MVQTLIQLRDEVRMILGSPSKKELDDAQVDYAIQDTISVYTRYRPIKVTNSLSLVADTQDYTLPNDIIGVSEVITDTTGIGLDPIVGVEISHSIEVINDLLAKRGRTDGSWHFEPSSHKLTIYNVPVYSTTGYYIGLKSHTVSSIPDKDKHLIMRYAEGVCKVMMGTGRAKRMTKIPTYYYRGGSAESGMMQLDDGTRLRSEGEDIKKEVLKQLQGATCFITVG